MEHKYFWLTTETQNVRLRYQGCRGMKVALSTDPLNVQSNTYLVAVGANSGAKSLIRRGLDGQDLVSVATPGIISCNNLRS